MRIYPLWAFSDGRRVVITRGETEEQAMSYAAWSPSFPKGVTIYPTVMPLEAAKFYSENHAAGWLHRKPRWLQKAEMEVASKKGSKRVIADLFDGVKDEAVLFEPRFVSTSC